MSKDIKIVDDMVDYVAQLRRHTEGRRSIHVKLSKLEKQFRQEHYRRFSASALRPLITNFGATMFALPNADLILIVQGASIDTIDILLRSVRREFRDAEIMKNIDPVQGKSDSFVEWFDLAKQYEAFQKYIARLAENLINLDQGAKVDASKLPDDKKIKGLGKIISHTPALKDVSPISLSKQVKLVPINAPRRKFEDHPFDPELLVQMVKAVRMADVGGMLRKQRVLAIMAGGERKPVMVHKFVPREVVFEKLLEAPVVGENVWLDGYIADLLASRVLFSAPNMLNGTSIASSIRATTRSILDGSFDEFSKSLGSISKSKVIVEFTVQDIFTNFEKYRQAQAKLSQEGFKILISDLDLPALLWLNCERFAVDFIKVRLPEGEQSEWVTDELMVNLKRCVKHVGQARLILAGCMSDQDIELGHKFGVTLFQGIGVEDYWQYEPLH